MHRSYDGRSASRGSNHGNSSAFSANANANEDWTKISDLAERRRIQNRIAQRNYRKKLKRRLEDLERRAATSPSPEEPPADPVPPKAPVKTRTRQRAPKTSGEPKPPSQAPERPAPDYYTPEDRGVLFAHQCTRQLSASPPPTFYPLPYDAYRQTAYAPPIYHTVPSMYHGMAFPTEYGHSPHGLIPAAHVGARKPPYDEDMISPFSMSYATMAGIDLCAPQPQSQPEPGMPMPSLAYGYTEDQRAPSTSPETSIFTFPLTPESAPCSPRSMPGLYEYDLRP
ncbi:hypothetical protein NUU61_009715 [Penicillium alfredii]|uniref:BZIP domain-containing protein n=1 Tax=Penicillium alfredii TaxID=1506179 RepID=A0A9W9JTX8_9EURO|nr:uncharacterized protein NUU61_009715 [Penicillium alfredii]KAJ5081451.1 hypothetical protein NUU61_009715 [Penicillium alfredii]